MAAIVRHGFFKTGRLLSTKNVYPRCYATKAEKRKGIDRKIGPKIDSSAQSLAAKGFLRPQKEYQPPADVKNTVNTICKEVLGNSQPETKIADVKQRFDLFQRCANTLKHSIPSSLLHSVETVGDLVQFYATPVDTTTPFDKMRNMELPENLHVQFQYHRFHPDTDKMFNGQTAFNKSSTLVTGLKYKDKYPGHIQEDSIYKY